MRTKPFTSSRGCLSYIIYDETAKEAALIDPSAEIPDATYRAFLEREGLTLRYIIETHTHADHVSSAAALRTQTGAHIARHQKAPSACKDIVLSNDTELPLGASVLSIRMTPGHTDESISVYVDGSLFTGDALLISGTGRTDFQLGDSAALYETLHHTYGAFPDETIIYPAHDYRGNTSSSLGVERRENPRMQLTRDAFISAMNAHHPPLPELFETALAINSR